MIAAQVDGVGVQALRRLVDAGVTFVSASGTGLSRAASGALVLSVDGVGIEIIRTSAILTDIRQAAAETTVSNGRNLRIRGGPGGTTSGNGGTASVAAGLVTDGNGGTASINGTGGVGTNRNGGDVYVNGGGGTGTATGGGCWLNGGNSLTGNGGVIVLTPGASAGGWTGQLSLNALGATKWCMDGANWSWRPGTDNNVDLGSSSVRPATIYSVSGAINTSDIRTKTDIAPVGFGLDFVLSVAPIRYRMIEGRRRQTKAAVVDRDEDGRETVLEPAEFEPVPGSRVHLGFSAQDIRAGLGSDGYAAWTLDDPANPDSRQGLRPDQLVPILWAAVREQQAQINALMARLEALET